MGTTSFGTEDSTSNRGGARNRPVDRPPLAPHDGCQQRSSVASGTAPAARPLSMGGVLGPEGRGDLPFMLRHLLLSREAVRACPIVPGILLVKTGRTPQWPVRVPSRALVTDVLPMVNMDVMMSARLGPPARHGSKVHHCALDRRHRPSAHLPEDCCAPADLRRRVRLLTRQAHQIGVSPAHGTPSICIVD